MKDLSDLVGPGSLVINENGYILISADSIWEFQQKDSDWQPSPGSVISTVGNKEWLCTQHPVPKGTLTGWGTVFYLVRMKHLFDLHVIPWLREHVLKGCIL